MSGLRRQLSVCKNKRHRGKDEPHAPLLLELEVDACWDGDVVIGAEQGDQGNHEAGMGLDDSLAIKPGAEQGLTIVQENYFACSAPSARRRLMVPLGASQIPYRLHRTLTRAWTSGVNPATPTRPQA